MQTDRSVGTTMLPKANSTVKKEVSGIEHLPGTAPHHVGTAALGCPAAQVYRAAGVFWEGMDRGGNGSEVE